MKLSNLIAIIILSKYLDGFAQGNIGLNNIVQIEEWSDSVQTRLTFGGDYLLEPRVIIYSDSVHWSLSGLNGVCQRNDTRPLQEAILAIDSVQFNRSKSECKYEVVIYIESLKDDPVIQKIAEGLSDMKCSCILYIRNSENK